MPRFSKRILPKSRKGKFERPCEDKLLRRSINEFHFQCNLKHEFMCPNSQSKDGCTVVRCPYVHKNKPIIQLQRTPSSIVATEPSISSTSTTTESNTRYFVSNNQKPNDNQKTNNSANDIAGTSPNTETTDDSTDSVDCEINEEATAFSQRKRLGKLPSFIPLS